MSKHPEGGGIYFGGWGVVSRILRGVYMIDLGGELLHFTAWGGLLNEVIIINYNLFIFMLTEM